MKFHRGYGAFIEVGDQVWACCNQGNFVFPDDSRLKPATAHIHDLSRQQSGIVCDIKFKEYGIVTPLVVTKWATTGRWAAMLGKKQKASSR